MPLPWEQDFSGAQAPAATSAMPWEKDYGAAGSSPQASALQAAGEGMMDTVGMGYRDEIRAASKISGLPDWLGGFRAPVGALKLHNEDMSGGDGSLRREYEKIRDETKQFRGTAQEQHPDAYFGGQIAGGAAVLGAPPVSTGAGVVGSAVAKPFRAMPDWMKAVMASGAVGIAGEVARELGAPESVLKWIEQQELIHGFKK